MDVVSLGVVLTLVALIVWAGVLRSSVHGFPLAEHYRENSVKEIGALNVVAAIYLGYRAYDTVGETIVLIIAVTGVSYLVSEGKHGTV